MKNQPQHHVRKEKIVSIEDAKDIAAQIRQKEKIIVTTNGTFDILHAGHLDMLEEAKQQGDVLFVGINNDAAVAAKKGQNRPVIRQEHRAALLAALICVDYIVVLDGDYDEEPATTFLPAIRPDVHVNFEDYGTPDTWLEWPVMQECGTKPYIVKKRPGLSTSEIIDKIRL